MPRGPSVSWRADGRRAVQTHCSHRPSQRRRREHPLTSWLGIEQVGRVAGGQATGGVSANQSRKTAQAEALRVLQVIGEMSEDEGVRAVLREVTNNR